MEPYKFPDELNDEELKVIEHHIDGKSVEASKTRRKTSLEGSGRKTTETKTVVPAACGHPSGEDSRVCQRCKTFVCPRCSEGIVCPKCEQDCCRVCLRKMKDIDWNEVWGCAACRKEMESKLPKGWFAIIVNTGNVLNSVFDCILGIFKSWKSGRSS